MPKQAIIKTRNSRPDVEILPLTSRTLEVKLQPCKHQHQSARCRYLLCFHPFFAFIFTHCFVNEEVDAVSSHISSSLDHLTPIAAVPQELKEVYGLLQTDPNNHIQANLICRKFNPEGIRLGKYCSAF